MARTKVHPKQELAQRHRRRARRPRSTEVAGRIVDGATTYSTGCAELNTISGLHYLEGGGRRVPGLREHELSGDRCTVEWQDA